MSPPPMQRPLPLDAEFRRPSKRAAVDLVAELARTRVERDVAVERARDLQRRLVTSLADNAVLREANARLRGRILDHEST